MKRIFITICVWCLSNYANGWTLYTQSKPKVNCSLITNQLFEINDNRGIGHSMDLHNVTNEIYKYNVKCATVYKSAQEIVIVDNLDDDNIHMKNLHIVKTNPHMSNTIIDKLTYYDIPFDIELNRPISIHTTPFMIRILFWMYYVYIFYYFCKKISSIFLRNTFITMLEQRGQDILDNTAYEEHIPNIDKNNKTTFRQIAGCDEAKYELTEIVEFLKHPDRFVNSGAKIPAGILLEGPPGTGKTMLAKATANEAGVSFISASGSQFIEMYVGVGAMRVRKLFEQAKEKKPCIIFIDEIDAIGQKRSNGNDERYQTLNQLLTSMDGFQNKDGIIVIAATNRADVLDKALTRPGRFDRKITVGLPDKEGRQQILEVHLKNKRLDVAVNMGMISELTAGFSGADLANLANEAAILSVRYNTDIITKKCLVDAFEKITIGLPKNKDNRTKDSIKLVAYHEGGHALIALFFKDIFDVRRVTINANNSGAGGYTLFTPKEQYVNLPSKRYMLANIIVSLGGRAAEILLFKGKSNGSKSMYNELCVFNGIHDLDITAGASNDLKQANELARKYVSVFGLGKRVGLYDHDAVSDDYNSHKMSEHTKTKIDREVKKMVNYALKCATGIIEHNADNLERISNLLIAYKTITEEQLNEHVVIKFDYL